MVKVCVLTLVLVICLSMGVLAQSVLDQAEISVHVHVPAIITIALSSEEITFTSEEILAAEQSNGQLIAMKTSALSVDVAGNIHYYVHVQSAAEYFRTQDGSGIPISRLEWRYPSEDEDASWIPLSMESTPVLGYGSPGFSTLLFDLRLTIHQTDPIGIYSGTLIFTLGSD